MTAKKFNNLELKQSIREKLNEHADLINENKEAIENISWWSLDDLSDVIITTPTSWQSLTYNGTDWVNSTPAWAWDMLKSVYDPANWEKQVAFSDDTRFSDSREWNADTVSQAESEAGTATTRRAWTAQRVRQAISSWWDTISLAISDIAGLQDELDWKANTWDIPTDFVDLSTAQTIGGQKTFTMLTDNDLWTTGWTVAINWVNWLNQKITLNANTTFTFANPRQGHVHEILLTQDSTARTVTFPTITWANGTAPDLSVVSGTYLIQLTYRGTTYFWASISFNA